MDIRSSAPAHEIKFTVKSYNTAGDLVSEESVIRPVDECAETVRIDLSGSLRVHIGRVALRLAVQRQSTIGLRADPKIEEERER